MAISVRYTKAQYQAKIAELEGYYALLEQHLARMIELKDQMFTFWDDSNAQTTGQILVIRINSVRSAMDRTHEMLTFYRSAVEKMDGANLSVGTLLEEALGILGGLGL